MQQLVLLVIYDPIPVSQLLQVCVGLYRSSILLICFPSDLTSARQSISLA